MKNEKIAEKIHFTLDAVCKAELEIIKARFALLRLQAAMPQPERKLERKTRQPVRPN